MCFLLELYFFNYRSLLLFMMFSIHYYHMEAGTVISFQAVSRHSSFIYIRWLQFVCFMFTAYQLFSGCVMLTRRDTILQKDFTNSSVPYTVLW